MFLFARLMIKDIYQNQVSSLNLFLMIYQKPIRLLVGVVLEV